MLSVFYTYKYLDNRYLPNTYYSIILRVAWETHLWKMCVVQVGFIFFLWGNYVFCRGKWTPARDPGDCKHSKEDRDLCAINNFFDGNKNNINTCIIYFYFFECTTPFWAYNKYRLWSCYLILYISTIVRSIICQTA